MSYPEAQYAVDEIKDYTADKVTVDKIYEIVSDSDIYGFIEHMDILDPASRIEYIGKNKNFSPISITMGGGFSLGDWADFPLLVNNKPYMVQASGVVDYELSSTDYTKKVDGSTASDVSSTSYAGGAFSWLQKIYKKEYIVGSDRYVKFSLDPKDGYSPIGFIDTEGNELEGVWLPMFYGSIVDSKMRSTAGTTPAASNQTSAEKAAIDAFGARAKFLGGSIINTIIDLLLMWGKNCNLQDKYGYGNCNGGQSGVKNNTIVSGGQFYGTTDKTSLNKILHSVVLGSYQQWMRDPYTICVNGKVKVSPKYAYDLNASGYQDAGVQYPASGGWYYPNRCAVEPGFGAIPSPPFDGSTTLGWCDGLYVNIGITAVSLRFGNASNDLNAGLRALYLGDAATTAHWNFGAALLLLPPAGHTPYAVIAST